MTTLIPRIPPPAILDDPDALIHNAEKYFAEAPPWTGEGLARALGFASYSHLQRVFAKANEDKDSPRALFVIERALSIIADDFIKGALITDYNASFTKFILSAHHNTHEKSVQEIHETSDRRIVIETVRPDSSDFNAEVNRLKQAALPASTQNSPEAADEAQSLEDIL